MLQLDLKKTCKVARVPNGHSLSDVSHNARTGILKEAGGAVSGSPWTYPGLEGDRVPEASILSGAQNGSANSFGRPVVHFRTLVICPVVLLHSS